MSSRRKTLWCPDDREPNDRRVSPEADEDCDEHKNSSVGAANIRPRKTLYSCGRLS